MLNFSRINCVLAKQSCPNQTWRLFLNVAESNCRKNYKVDKLASSAAGVCNWGRYTDSVVPLNQRIFRLYSEKNDFIFSRNFSMSNSMWSSMQSNQDKEKVRNYVFFGTVIISVIFVVYMFQTMEYHQDYVHIEPSDKKK